MSKQSRSITLFVLSIGGMLGCLSDDTLAYEQATHAAVTREAVMQSQLSPARPDLLQRIGMSGRQVSLGKMYFDVGDSGVVVTRSNSPGGPQSPLDFGRAKINAANGLAAYQPTADSLSGWLMLGAIREDDVKYDAGAAENSPQDEPGGATNRVLNHFYDPYHDTPLTVAGAVLGGKANDWALLGVNHFSVASAREAMWRALTLKSSPTKGVADLSFTPSSELPSREAVRLAYWATTFRALGDIVHLLQDMAQPQHTRNDPHSGLNCDFDAQCTGGHASFYEKYVDASVEGKPRFTLRERNSWQSLTWHSWAGGPGTDTTVRLIPRSVSYAGYPIPQFTDYRSYFVTASGPASLGGKGLANYSNQGFYTAGTNVGPGASASGYPAPSPNGQGLTDVALLNGTVVDANDLPLVGALILKTGSVIDAANSAYDATVRLSSYGAFDQFLRPSGRSLYTLNHYNYDDQMRLLIPRAVAYSAGLLDFFFRGRMEIALPDEGIYSVVDHAQFASQSSSTDPINDFKGFKEIRLRLSNSTPPIVTTSDGTTVPQGMATGTLVAVFKFHRNACYRDTLDGEITDPQQFPWCRTYEEEIVVSDPIKVPDQGAIPMIGGNPGSTEFTFKFSDKSLPINAWDVVLQVVYRGQLGTESDAVVVETRRISEPTFITTFNDTDRIRLSGSCYDPATVAATDALWVQLSSACKPTSGAARYVTSVCVNVPLSVRLTTGSSNRPLTVAMDYSSAQGHPIAPRRFARFAILSDFGAETTMALGLSPLLLQSSTTSRYRGYRAEQEDQITFARNAYQVTTSTIADAHTMHRGIKVWQGQSFVVDGTIAMVGGVCPESQFEPLQGPDRYPQNAVITGWDNP